jgi:hypothetical protein
LQRCDTKDKFVKVNGTGLFAERPLHVDWLEERSLSAIPTVVTPSDEFLAPGIRADGINVDAARVILRGKEDCVPRRDHKGRYLLSPPAVRRENTPRSRY